MGEQEGRARGVGRSNEEPTLRIGERRVFKDVEAEGFGEEGEGFVVVADEEGDVSDGLRHGWALWQRRQPTRKVD